ncbi:UNVERIFIED_CONTAM: hypothetical protein Slati_1141100 [Sesamum latifolium]|uniref:DDE Tnp4 domain-containing protein n=1 Tax=Sesamum latifolium TaxID=2727402 RepID=A0AAW2XBY8_9LAMI
MSPSRIILALITVPQILVEIAVALIIFVHVTQYIKSKRHFEPSVRRRFYKLNSRIPDPIRNLHRLVSFSDESCLRNLRMDRNASSRLRYMLEQSSGVKATKNVTVPEQMTMFLSVIFHHKKNCMVKHDFLRSGRTGCLGALDGTFIDVRVSEHEKGRYHIHKGQDAVNVFGVCNPNMQFICVLSGWEGSEADDHVLLDAIHRPSNLRVLAGILEPTTNAFKFLI